MARPRRSLATILAQEAAEFRTAAGEGRQQRFNDLRADEVPTRYAEQVASATMLGIPTPRVTPTDRPTMIAQMRALDDEMNARIEISLDTFVKQAWPLINPGTPYVDNWHNGAICRHLEAVIATQIRMLLILVPPRLGKSTATSVCLTPWAWIRQPELRFMFASYGSSLSLELAVTSRRLIDSDWYQSRWGHTYQLTTDQNVKASYENTRRGTRISTSIEGGVTGRGGDILVIDDPHNMERIRSDAERHRVREAFYRGSWHNRVNDEATAGRICIMQRGHPDDLAQYLLEIGYEPLVLPNEYDPKRSAVTSLGWKDPRQTAGELLCEARISAATTAQLKRVGMSMYQAQYQQEPLPEEGRLFKTDRITIEAVAPTDIARWVRFWDVAGTEGGSGARTAGIRMGRDGAGRYVICGITKGRWSDDGVQREIEQAGKLDGRTTMICEEQEPGSSGKAVIRARARALAGHEYRGVPSSGDKVTRARPFATQVEAGNVVVIARTDAEASDAREFIDELRDFPHGLKDQADAASGAFNVLVGSMSPSLEIGIVSLDATPREAEHQAMAYLKQRGHSVTEHATTDDTDGIEDLLS